MECAWLAPAPTKVRLATAPIGSWTGAVRAQEGAEAGPAASPARGRILIVEDEYFVALDAENALSDAGFTVVGIAATAEEAVEMAEAERPEVVLMDIRLVGARDGIDAAAEIRRRLGISSLFATAHSDVNTRARGDGAAVPLGWLTKPYTPAELVAAITAAVARARRGAAG
jgi:DNA-binding response OmpR family regulator